MKDEMVLMLFGWSVAFTSSPKVRYDEVNIHEAKLRLGFKNDI